MCLVTNYGALFYASTKISLGTYLTMPFSLNSCFSPKFLFEWFSLPYIGTQITQITL